jgi:cytochrome c peroxidase
MRSVLLRLAFCVSAALLAGCMHDTADTANKADPIGPGPSPNPSDPGEGEVVAGVAPEIRVLPPRFPRFADPVDNPLTADKAFLGRHLFYDKRLSLDSTISCASCHRQDVAFSDAGVTLSPGVGGALGKRNTPGLTNVAYNRSFFAEGGVPTLELQAIAPIINPKEMNLHTDTLVGRLAQDTVYARLFVLAWGSREVTISRITHALAAFQRTLISGHSAYDRFLGGDVKALNASAKRGVDLFFGEKGDCFHCHNAYNLTDNLFHNTGLDVGTPDEGRFGVTDNPADKGKFKTPTLRNVGLTAPYMHDGRFKTLEEVLNHYNTGGKSHSNASGLMRPLGLSATDRADIISFLHSLTDSAFISDDRLADPWVR